MTHPFVAVSSECYIVKDIVALAWLSLAAVTKFFDTQYDIDVDFGASTNDTVATMLCTIPATVAKQTLIYFHLYSMKYESR